MSKHGIHDDLIRRVAAGDPLAQERFVLICRPRIMEYIARRVPPELRRSMEPSDIFQEVCFDAFRQFHTFHGDDVEMAIRWMLRITRNRVIDLVRTQQAAKRGGDRVVELPDGDDSVISLLQELAVHEKTPSRSAIRHEFHVQLEACLRRLPPDYRTVVRLRYIDGLSVNEVAEKMQRTLGSVTMLCTRALKQLREEMRSFSRYL